MSEIYPAITPAIQVIIDKYSLAHNYKEYADTFFGKGLRVHDFLYSEQNDMYDWCFCHFTVNVDGDYFTIQQGTFEQFHISLLETKLIQWLDLLGVRVCN